MNVQKLREKYSCIPVLEHHYHPFAHGKELEEIKWEE